jgi:hypothetical protein
MLDVLVAGPYNETFFLGVAAVATLFWRDANRRNWPVEFRAAVIASVLVAGIIGSRWLPLEGHLPAYGEKTVLGALLGAAIAVAIIGSRFHLGGAVFDLAIPSIPVGMAIGRIGCFVAGCCFGTPLALPWGVRYNAGSSPFRFLVSRGLVAPDATQTGLLHPVQLYEAAADLLLVLLVVRVRHRFRSPGASALAFGAMYGTARFALEFVRAEGTFVAGLKLVQWGLALAVAAMVLALSHRERAARRLPAVPRAPDSASKGPSSAPASYREFAAVVVTCALASLPWATPLERTSVLAAVTIALLVLARRGAGAPAFGIPAGAWAMLFVFQTAGSPPVPDSLFPRSYTAVGGSVLSTWYSTTAPDGCSDQQWTREHQAALAQLSISRQHQTSRDAGSGITGGFIVGSDHASIGSPTGATSGRSALPAASLPLLGGSVAVNMDGKWFGLTLGAAVGSLGIVGGSSSLGVDSVTALPIVGLRVGRLSHWYGEFALLDPYVSSLPRGAARLGLGFAVDSLGSTLRIGASDVGGYVSYRAITESNWEIEPLLAVGGTFQARLALRRRFGVTKSQPHRAP